ncbi:hypothetical protein B0G71_5020 [Paraburkholderia sp. BL27I4N3]|nr:hypothetical protein B0G71_5020 [Paraburkholderia sp. BL27I4N3]
MPGRTRRFKRALARPPHYGEPPKCGKFGEKEIAREHAASVPCHGVPDLC